MVAFKVDIDELGGLAPHLTKVVSTLDDEGHNSLDHTVIGFDDGVSAMGDFVSGWSYGRSQISSSVKSAQGDLTGTSGNYKKAETGLGTSFSKSEATLGGGK